MYPLEGLKLAGVDMSSPEPVDSAFAVLAEMVDRLEKLVAARDSSNGSASGKQ
jgi:oligoendopeptidase F